MIGPDLSEFDAEQQIADLKRENEQLRAKVAARTDVNELDKVKQENAQLRRALAAVHKTDVAAERALDMLDKAVERAVCTYKPAAKRKPGKVEPHTLALLFSDAHAGEVVSLEETNGLGEYNYDIMLGRMRTLADRVRSHNDHYGPARARKLVITSLGDGISGEIHEELKDTNEYANSELMVRFGEDVGEWIATEFAGEFDEIEMVCVPGNHPRFTKKERSKLKWDNGDFIASHYTRLKLEKYPHVKVVVPKAARAVVNICGEEILCLHGQGVKSTMVGVPWGGILRQSERLQKLFDLVDVKVDRVFAGHWHNPNLAEDWSVVINGSLKGIDEYVVDRALAAKPPSQVLTVFHPKHGMTGAHKLDLA